MSKLTILELKAFYNSDFSGSPELFFSYNNTEYVIIFYSEGKRVSIQKLYSKIKEKYYYSFEELLNSELIDNSNINELIKNFNFYEEYTVDYIKSFS